VLVLSTHLMLQYQCVHQPGRNLDLGGGWFDVRSFVVLWFAECLSFFRITVATFQLVSPALASLLPAVAAYPRGWLLWFGCGFPF
jgi:hypothetical protein